MKKLNRNKLVAVIIALLFGLILTGIGTILVMQYTVIDVPPSESELITEKVKVERLKRRSAGRYGGGAKYYTIEADGAEYVLMGRYDKYAIVDEITEGDTVTVLYSDGVFGDYAHAVKVNGRTVVHYTSYVDRDLLFSSVFYGGISIFFGILSFLGAGKEIYEAVFRKSDEDILNDAMLQKDPEKIRCVQPELRLKHFSGAYVVSSFVGSGDVMSFEIKADISKGIARLMLADADGVNIREISLRDEIRFSFVTEPGKRYCLKLCGARLTGSFELKSC